MQSRAPLLVRVQTQQHTSHPKKKVPAKEEGNAMPLSPAKPSPSFINLQASSPPATFLNIQTTKVPSAQGMSETPRMYVCQSPASDPACLTTDGSCGKFASIHDTTVSWEGKQELFLFSPSLIPQSVVKSLAPVQ
ncbi:TSSK6-activating co-chaperone protein [Manis pentadactyla]|uniref:TSSK6-activating co-chaperone protein n=1 Tax=Manis pentadactyla TaxID=143292 RepID=UPI00255C9597|nr:TSSK6-activating co-chaperone protein [Manis pentadactyla]